MDPQSDRHFRRERASRTLAPGSRAAVAQRFKSSALMFVVHSSWITSSASVHDNFVARHARTRTSSCSTSCEILAWSDTDTPLIFHVDPASAEGLWARTPRRVFQMKYDLHGCPQDVATLSCSAWPCMKMFWVVQEISCSTEAFSTFLKAFSTTTFAHGKEGRSLTARK